MKSATKKLFKIGLVMGVCTLGGAALAEQQTHWTYEGEEGAANWGKLDSGFKTCATGKTQSPIDIQPGDKAAKVQLAFDYKPSPLKILNNGHTIQVNYDSGSFLQIGKKSYELLQFHFHTPSEHLIDGEKFSMELHLVHKSEDGKLAVVGVMIQPGEPNQMIESVWNNSPLKQAPEKKVEGIYINALNLLPRKGGYYSYPGSLTTPPCSEGVAWNVLKTPIEFSQGQISKFVKIFKNNSRPAQPLKGRSIGDI